MPNRETRDTESRASTLTLGPEALWTLHAVLGWWLDSSNGDRQAVRDAFERLESGELRFTRRQLAAMEQALAAAHHRPTEVAERSDIERLLHQVSGRLDAVAEA